VLGRFWVPDWALFGRLFAIGAPISATMLLEYGVFAAAALLMGWLGTAALAAHQIAITTASIMFMVPFGVSMAATVRVGHAVGRRDAEATRRAGMAAIALGASFFIADGIQTVAAGALRGLNDTRMTLVYAAICFWVIGFSICYALGFPLRYGAPGIWVGLSIGLALYALLLIRRFHRLTKRGYLPDIATPT
jgi:MATE family multidrug resistance protein